LKLGNEQKRVAATAMNDRSSRAHSLFILKLQQACQDTRNSVTSILFLADLGGSEHIKKSQTDAARTQEAVNINLDLLELKQVVDALNKCSKKRGRNKDAYIPYAGSKLTRLLSQDLGGDSKTNIVICGSQDPEHASETMAAIQFGQECAQISSSNSTRRGYMEQFLQDMVTDLDQRNESCNQNVREQERWETRQERRLDGYGGFATVTTSQLVGAETHRQELKHN
jgi:kinesin family protein 5